MCSTGNPDGADTQDLRRVEDDNDEVRAILKKRQEANTPVAYRVLAAVTGGAALVLWGVVAASSVHEPGAPIDRAYGAFLTFSAVVGVAAVITGVIWLRERDASRHRAEADRIRRYRSDRLVKRTAAAVMSALHEEQRAERIQRFERAFTDASAQRPGNPVIPFPQPRGESRNSS